MNLFRRKPETPEPEAVEPAELHTPEHTEKTEAERFDTEEAPESLEDYMAKEVERSRPAYEKVLEIVDPDIAESFKNFGVGGYHLDFPIKLQIARSLKKLVRLLEQKES